MAFKQAFQQADPQILEPIYTLTVLCPDELTGHIIGDLQTRRGIMEGMDTEGHFTKITAKVPHRKCRTILLHCGPLHREGQNSGWSFHEYAPVPFEMQRKLIDEYNKLSGKRGSLRNVQMCKCADVQICGCRGFEYLYFEFFTFKNTGPKSGKGLLQTSTSDHLPLTHLHICTFAHWHICPFAPIFVRWM